MLRKPVQLKLGEVRYVYNNEAAEKANKILASMIADYIRKNDISKQQSNKTDEKEC